MKYRQDIMVQDAVASDDLTGDSHRADRLHLNVTCLNRICHNSNITHNSKSNR